MKLTQNVSFDRGIPEQDTLELKNALRRLGHYQTPKYGMTPYPDQGMFDGIKAFQKQMGISPTGAMRKDGPEHQAMAQHLAMMQNQNPQSDRFSRFFENAVKREGGYSDHPDDSGGKTKYGITERTLNSYQQRHGNLGANGQLISPRELTKEQAKPIYKNFYYDQYRIKDIKDEKSAEHAFDLFVNHKPNTAGTFIQNAINNKIPNSNLKVDGIVGSKTIDAINKATPEQSKAFNQEIIRLRKEHMRQQPESLRRGLINRAESFE